MTSVNFVVLTHHLKLMGLRPHYFKKMFLARLETLTDDEWSVLQKLFSENKVESEGEPKTDAPHTAIIDTRLVSYYYRLASAGSGQILFDEPPSKQISIPDEPRYKNVSYAIGVNGRSMEPMFYDGDILLIEMCDRVDMGGIGIFSVDGQCYVKKLGKTELISLNPEYENIPMDESARCFGRVVGKL